MIRALFGGTFDPIHQGHLNAANALVDELGIDQLHLMPNAVPPHRSQPSASPEQRLTMVNLACQQYPKLVAEPFELNSDGPSYTAKTLQRFAQLYPDEPLLFVMGMDSLINLDQWYQWQHLLDYAHLIALPRPGYQLTQASPTLQQYIAQHRASKATLTQQPSGSIYIAHTPLHAISATAIRQHIAKQNACEDVPSSVLEYIVEQGLYKAD